MAWSDAARAAALEARRAHKKGKQGTPQKFKVTVFDSSRMGAPIRDTVMVTGRTALAARNSAYKKLGFGSLKFLKSQYGSPGSFGLKAVVRRVK